MIPIPQYLQQMAKPIEGNDDRVRFSVNCTCGNAWFSVFENCLSAEEKALEIPYEKACKKLACGMWGAAVTVDEAGNTHHWKLMTPFGLKGWKKEILLPPAPMGSLITVVKCKCLQCGQEHILFDSRCHGYEGLHGDKEQELLDYMPLFRQLRKKCRLEICVFNDPIEEPAHQAMDEYSNGFDWINIYALSETGKVSTILDYETA